MARFDIFPNFDQGYLLDIQTDLLSGLNTRICVPLMPPGVAPKPGPRLNPTFQIDGRPYVMVTQFMASVAMADLRQPAGNLTREYDRIVAALDMIFLGF